MSATPIWGLADQQEWSAVSDIVKMLMGALTPPSSHLTLSLLSYLLFPCEIVRCDHTTSILVLSKACMTIILLLRIPLLCVLEGKGRRVNGAVRCAMGGLCFASHSCSRVSKGLSPLHSCTHTGTQSINWTKYCNWTCSVKKGLKLQITYGLSSSNGLLCPWEPWLQAKLYSALIDRVKLRARTKLKETVFYSENHFEINFYWTSIQIHRVRVWL